MRTTYDDDGDDALCVGVCIEMEAAVDTILSLVTKLEVRSLRLCVVARGES